MKKLLFILGASLAVLPAVGCNMTKITLDKTSVNIAMGNSLTLTASSTSPSADIKWTSDNESIAKIDNFGVITPVSAGKTKVTASIGNIKASCDVAIRMKTIILGVDGGGDFFSNSTTPNVNTIFESDPRHNSAVTIKKGCLTSKPTISAQCWGSMLCGVIPEVHKFDNDIISSTPNTEHPSIFYEARRQIPDAKLASFVNWSPINYGIVENGLDVDKRTRSDDGVLKDVICSYLKNNDPDLLYVQFDSVDHEGHAEGYGSDLYNAQLKVVDGYIGEIYETLKEKNVLSNYDFIVTADHGGTPDKPGTHGGDTDPEKYIYFAITGDNIKKHTGNKRVIQDMDVRDITAILAHCLSIDNNPGWGEESGIKIPDNIFIN